MLGIFPYPGLYTVKNFWKLLTNYRFIAYNIYDEIEEFGLDERRLHSDFAFVRLRQDEFYCILQDFICKLRRTVFTVRLFFISNIF